MARVFVAEETALDRKVVIKVLPPETAALVSLERFKREILLAAKLQHPHIVPLLTAGESNGLPYFTMPFVDGESLRVRLARSEEHTSELQSLAYLVCRLLLPVLHPYLPSFPTRRSSDLDQGAPAGDRGAGLARTFQARDPPCGQAPASTHRAAAHRGRVERPAVLHDAVRGRRVAAGSPR